MIDVNNTPMSNGGTHAASLRQLAGVAEAHGHNLVADAGVRVNFNGTSPADMLPIIANDVNDMYSAVGVLSGPGTFSQFFTVYDGPGNAWVFYRVGYNQSLGDGLEVARISKDGSWRGPAYSTAGRPSAVTEGVGAMIYDGTLSKPIWSDGTMWRDAAGATV